MRKIKFKGYSKELKKWMFGDLIHDTEEFFIAKEKTISRFGGGAYNTHSRIGWDDDNYYDINIVEKSSIGQYTGFEDENGIKIYEGDLINYENNGQYGIVTFKKGIFGVNYYYNLNTSDCPLFFTFYEIMYHKKQLLVTGNIYENKVIL